jgi:hypothetical protein
MRPSFSVDLHEQQITSKAAAVPRLPSPSAAESSPRASDDVSPPRTLPRADRGGTGHCWASSVDAETAVEEEAGTTAVVEELTAGTTSTPSNGDAGTS